MTNKLKDIVKDEDLESLSIWLRSELAKMVSEADCRHLIYTTFDQSLAAGVKNAVIRHIFVEWEL